MRLCETLTNLIVFELPEKSAGGRVGNVFPSLLVGGGQGLKHSCLENLNSVVENEN